MNLVYVFFQQVFIFKRRCDGVSSGGDENESKLIIIVEDIRVFEPILKSAQLEDNV